jgi:hypothetical protein
MGKILQAHENTARASVLIRYNGVRDVLKSEKTDEALPLGVVAIAVVTKCE